MQRQGAILPRKVHPLPRVLQGCFWGSFMRYMSSERYPIILAIEIQFLCHTHETVNLDDFYNRN